MQEEDRRMPMLDVYIPAGALEPDAEARLMQRLTDILLECEGADPANETAQAIAWAFLHRPAQVFVAGAPAEVPRYRVVASVPEGQWTDERRAAMVARVTEAILDAEPDERERDPMRVWVFPLEIPDGAWGGAGQIVRLRDIVALVTGNSEGAAAYAERVLAERRAPVAAT
jgi:phenylpyruvate tautomerase PptA (4-oxalocrotonate tautomerase family)